MTTYQIEIDLIDLQKTKSDLYRALSSFMQVSYNDILSSFQERRSHHVQIVREQVEAQILIWNHEKIEKRRRKRNENNEIGSPRAESYRR